jgi:hypothetical protein
VRRQLLDESVDRTVSRVCKVVFGTGGSRPRRVKVNDERAIADRLANVFPEAVRHHPDEAAVRDDRLRVFRERVVDPGVSEHFPATRDLVEDDLRPERLPSSAPHSLPNRGILFVARLLDEAPVGRVADREHAKWRRAPR